MNKVFWIVIYYFSFLATASYAAMNTDSGSAENMKLSVATFAAGCFWCVESDFEKLPGVHEVVSGYSAGHVINPRYDQFSQGNTGNVEAVQVYYDAEQISHENLLEAFRRLVDRSDNDGQFADRGGQYRLLIIVHDASKRQQAEASRKRLSESVHYDKPAITEFKGFAVLYPAEEKHQNYFKNYPIHYNIYRYRYSWDQYLQNVWGNDLHLKIVNKKQGRTYSKPSQQDLRKILTPLQYQVTQQDTTEKTFKNAFWNEKRAGIYVNVVSGGPIFSSINKFKSGTGRPSFVGPLVADNVIEKKDYLLFLPHTVIRSCNKDSHLDHVFNDGPEPTGFCYCINSAALHFVPREQMIAEGYGEFQQLFQE